MFFAHLTDKGSLWIFGILLRGSRGDRDDGESGTTGTLSGLDSQKESPRALEGGNLSREAVKGLAHSDFRLILEFSSGFLLKKPAESDPFKDDEKQDDI